MTTTNCGNQGHTDECLCDVRLPVDHDHDGYIVLPDTTLAISRFVDPIRHGFFGPEIARYLGISAPYKPEDLLKFFEMQVELHDRLHVEERIKLSRGRGAANSSLSDEVREHIARLVLDGKKSQEIRQVVLDTHGVKISAPYMSKLRKRLIKENK